MSIKKVALLALLVVTLFACRKEGPGGKAKVSGNITHQGVAVPNAIVYIKYGASDFPGTDISAYDRSYNSDVNGYFAIGSLVKGNYYIYAVGYDVTSAGITEKLTGGINISLTRKESKQQDIAVTK